MPSKEVTDRQKDARAVLAAAETHGAAAARAFAAELQPYLRAGESAPDLTLLFTLVARRLEASLSTLVTADEAHTLELGDDAIPRQKRDEAAAALRQLAIEIRDQVVSVHGDAALDPLSVRGDTPTDPVALAEWCRTFAKQLRAATVTLPQRLRRTASIDRTAMAEELEGALGPLDRALAAVAREKREAEATQAAKSAAAERYDLTFSQSAGLYASVFRVAGLADLADRVRPVRRAARAADGQDPPPNG